MVAASLIVPSYFELAPLPLKPGRGSLTKKSASGREIDLTLLFEGSIAAIIICLLPVRRNRFCALCRTGYRILSSALFLYRTCHRRDVVLNEEGVEDDERQGP